jgi:hypothetical protein
LRRRRRLRVPWVPEHEDDGYRGPARVELGDEVVDVDVTLTGHLEPLDGRYHWYGRIAQHDAVDAAKRDGLTDVALTIGAGTPAAGRLAEHDAWGNMRITGLGAPPFELEPVEVDLFEG